MQCPNASYHLKRNNTQNWISILLYNSSSFKELSVCLLSQLGFCSYMFSKKAEAFVHNAALNTVLLSYTFFTTMRNGYNKRSHYFLKKQRFKDQNRKGLYFPDFKHLVSLVYTIIILPIISTLFSAVLRVTVLDI